MYAICEFVFFEFIYHHLAEFYVICFDMVSEPSTPGAYMLREGKNITKKELAKHFNKSDRIDRIFNDIITWEK